MANSSLTTGQIQRVLESPITTVTESVSLTGKQTASDTWGKQIPLSWGASRVDCKLIWSSPFYNVVKKFRTTTQYKDVAYESYFGLGRDGTSGSSVVQTGETVTTEEQSTSFLDMCFSAGKEGDPRQKRVVAKIFVNGMVIYDASTGFIAPGLALSIRYGYDELKQDPVMMDYPETGKYFYPRQTYVVFDRFPLANYGNALPQSVEVEFTCSVDVPPGDGDFFPAIRAGGQYSRYMADNSDPRPWVIDINDMDNPMFGIKPGMLFVIYGQVVNQANSGADKLGSLLELTKDGWSILTTNDNANVKTLAISKLVSQSDIDTWRAAGYTVPGGTVGLFNVYPGFEEKASGPYYSEYIWSILDLGPLSSNNLVLSAASGPLVNGEVGSQLTAPPQSGTFILFRGIDYKSGSTSAGSGAAMTGDNAGQISLSTGVTTFYAGEFAPVLRPGPGENRERISPLKDVVLSGANNASYVQIILRGLYVEAEARVSALAAAAPACSVSIFSLIQSLYMLSGDYAAEDIINDGITDTVLGAYLLNNYTLEAIVSDICYIFRIERDLSQGRVRLYRSREPGTDITIAAEISVDDLIPTSEDQAWTPLNSNFLSSSQVPTQIGVKFLDPNNDYRENVINARRPDALRTDPIKQVALPLVMPVPQVDRLVNGLLNQSRANTQEHTFTLPQRIAYLCVGDNILIRDRFIDLIVNIDTADINADITVSCTGKTVYTQAATPEVAVPSLPRSLNDVAARAASTEFVFDIPALDWHDVDATDAFEIYIGVGPKDRGNWPGGYITQKPGSDPTVTLFYQYPPDFPLYATTGAPLTNKRWITDSDELNVSFVNGDYDTANNTDRDALDLDRNKNLALYGAPGRWEVVQFEAIVDGKMRGIRRGLRGTEIHAGKHVVGDRLVLAPRGLALLRLAEVALGRVDAFAAVTQGTGYSAASPTPQPAFVGAARRPYAPACVRATRQDSGDVLLTWLRRDRGSDGRWGAAVLSEVNEAYTVKIRDGSTVKRTLESNKQSVTYTAADQATDGLSTRDVLSLEVTQIGNIGPGFSEIGNVNVIDA